MKTIKRMKRIVKMGVILSIAAIAFTAYSASASALQPSFDEDMIIDVDDVLFPEELIPLFGTDVDVEATGCLPHFAGPEGIDITITNNNDLAKLYEVFVYDGVVEIEQTPEFTFPEEATGSDSEFLFPGESHEFPRYMGPLFAPESPTVVRVQITESLPVLLIDEEDDVIVEADVIFDEEIIVCENDADEMLSEAAEEYAAAEALAEAEAEAEAAEAEAEATAEALAEAEATAEALAEAEAQATAEAEALEADLAAAEQAASDAEDALEAMIDAVSVDVEDYSTELEQDSQTEGDAIASNNQPLVDGESAVGELTEGDSDNLGLSVGMIILVTLIGVAGIASAGVALDKLNR
tara:strand:+ start:3663 stop:4718 length:1056 start_codon:yes stop_codon:yes gene_type:complete